MKQTNIDLNKIVGANLKRAIKESKWKLRRNSPRLLVLRLELSEDGATRV